jgi:hypothetical protein
MNMRIDIDRMADLALYLFYCSAEQEVDPLPVVAR